MRSRARRRASSPDDQKLSQLVGVRLSDEDLDHLHRLANFYQTSPQGIFRELLNQTWEEVKERVVSYERAREPHVIPLAKVRR